MELSPSNVVAAADDVDDCQVQSKYLSGHNPTFVPIKAFSVED